MQKWFALGKQQLQHKLARTDHLRRFGLDLHAVGHRKGAGRLQGALAGDFHEANPGSRRWGRGRMMAERGDVDARRGLGRLQHGLSGLGGNLSVR